MRSKQPMQPGTTEWIAAAQPDLQQFVLSESRFWCRMMREHALFIKSGLPTERRGLLDSAHACADRFCEIEQALCEQHQLENELLKKIMLATDTLSSLKEQVLGMLVSAELRASLFPLFMDHSLREVRRFQRLLIHPGAFACPPNPSRALLDTQLFWLRMMSEHLDLIIHLLDPSERSLILCAQQHRATFYELTATASDLLSIQHNVQPAMSGAASRFTSEVLSRMEELRTFISKTRELLVLHQVLSMIRVPQFADHLLREADKFVSETQQLKRLIPHAPN